MAHNTSGTSLSDRLLTCEPVGEFRNIADAELVVMVRAVVLKGTEADAELTGRFFARVTFDGDELRDFPLTRAKFVEHVLSPPSWRSVPARVRVPQFSWILR